MMSDPQTLLQLIQVAPGESTAIVLPEAGIRLTYNSLREHVTAVADALAALGIARGDRVATYLPNGLPAIVGFLAASVAGTAAPLNPGYREDEVAFWKTPGPRSCFARPTAPRARAKRPRLAACRCFPWRWIPPERFALPAPRVEEQLPLLLATT
jgi:hypothetical protein